MLPVEVLDPQPGEVVLDMSAAPGSKTTQIAAKMQGRGVIIANDVQEKRIWTLKAALHRCGVTNYIVTKKVGQWFMRHMTERFDRVLCDAPCTAQGTARKDSDALMYSSLENVGKMARLQRELLESAIDAAKVGGVVVYSTCTLTPEENEDVVLSMLEKFPGAIEVVDPRASLYGPIDRAVEDSMIVQKAIRTHGGEQPMIRLWPHVIDVEGFFCAKLRKVAPTRAREKHDPVRYQEDELPRMRMAEIGKGIEALYGSSFLHEGEKLYQRADQLLLSTDEIADFRLPVQDYSLGMPFAKRLEENRVRLTQELVTLRGAEATSRTWVINEEQLDQLFDGKDLTCPPELRGDVILLYRGIPVGSSLAKEGKLMNRLPRWIVQKS
jgi:16S rRNA (cytosine1407-C5)-methyltransferase